MSLLFFFALLGSFEITDRIGHLVQHADGEEINTLGKFPARNEVRPCRLILICQEKSD